MSKVPDDMTATEFVGIRNAVAKVMDYSGSPGAIENQQAERLIGLGLIDIEATRALVSTDKPDWML